MQLVMLFVQVGKKKKKRKNSQKEPFTDALQNICSKKIFLNIVKKTRVLESPFGKIAGLKVCIFIKKKTVVFLWIVWNFKEQFFYRTPRDFGCKIAYFSYSLCHCFVFLHFLCFSFLPSTLLESALHGYSVLTIIPKL